MRDIDTILAELKTALLEQVEVREKPGRNVSKKAKNIQHGDVVDLPYYGLTEINAWCRMGDSVMLGDGGQRNVTVGAEERLHIRRNFA